MASPATKKEWRDFKAKHRDFEIGRQFYMGKPEYKNLSISKEALFRETHNYCRAPSTVKWGGGVAWLDLVPTQPLSIEAGPLTPATTDTQAAPGSQTGPMVDAWPLKELSSGTDTAPVQEDASVLHL